MKMRDHRLKRYLEGRQELRDKFEQVKQLQKDLGWVDEKEEKENDRGN